MEGARRTEHDERGAEQALRDAVLAESQRVRRDEGRCEHEERLAGETERVARAITELERDERAQHSERERAGQQPAGILCCAKTQVPESSSAGKRVPSGCASRSTSGYVGCRNGMRPAVAAATQPATQCATGPDLSQRSRSDRDEAARSEISAISSTGHAGYHRDRLGE